MARGAQTEEAVYRRAVRSARVDAMILSSPLISDPRLALLRSLNMPFVVHGRTQSSEKYPFLDIDNEGAFFSATKLLTDLGHQRIALVNGAFGYNFSNDRLLGYTRALKARGLSVLPYFMPGGLMIEQHGYQEAERLFALPPAQQPTAFLCSSIAQAAGVQKAARGHGLMVGADISLIAHDDRLHDIRAETFDPPLTATQSSIGDAGKRVVELLIAQLVKQTDQRRNMAGRSRRARHNSALPTLNHHEL
jgi:LacI family transcriptional regulator